MQVSPTETAPFGCPKCRQILGAGEKLPNPNYPLDVWHVHCGLIFGTKSLRLHSLECPRCCALGDIKPAIAQAVPGEVPKHDAPPDPHRAYAKPTVGPQRFGVKALVCASCNAVRPVDPATGILETEVQMETGVYGLDKIH